MDFHLSITRKCLKWMEETITESVYYHYTRRAAKESIETSKVIWATESRHLQRKDKNEINECMNTFRRIVTERNLVPLFSEFFKFYKRETDVGNLNFFILSTTKTVPSDRHIAEYGEGDNQNYLTIESEFVLQNNRVENPKFELLFSHDVIYDNDKKVELLIELINEMKTALLFIYDTKEVKNPKTTREINDIFLACIQIILIYSSVFKDRNYEWENEHRFVFLRLLRYKKQKRKIDLKIFN